MKGGVPQKTPELLEKILQDYRDGHSLTQACKRNGVSRTAFYKWMDQDSDLVSAYTRARRDHIASMIDDRESYLADPARDAVHAKDKGSTLNYLRWRAEKLCPEVYGDRRQESAQVVYVKALPADVLDAVRSKEGADDVKAISRDDG